MNISNKLVDLSTLVAALRGQMVNACIPCAENVLDIIYDDDSTKVKANLDILQNDFNYDHLWCFAIGEVIRADVIATHTPPSPMLLIIPDYDYSFCN